MPDLSVTLKAIEPAAKVVHSPSPKTTASGHRIKARFDVGFAFMQEGYRSVGRHVKIGKKEDAWHRFPYFSALQHFAPDLYAERHLMTLGESVIRAGMLRSSYSPVGIVRESKPFLRQFPPAGQYVFRYSLSSGKGDWAAAKSYRTGMAFSNPLIPVSAVDELSGKPLPSTKSFCSLAADNVVVTALKKAERDGALVLRVVEMDGTGAETPVVLLGAKHGFRPVNLLEEESRPGDEETLRAKPHEISTVRLLIQ